MYSFPHSGRFKQSETSGAKLTPSFQDESRRPLTFPILSPTGPARNSALFLAASFSFFFFFCPFLSPRSLPPTRFRTSSWKLVFQRGFVAAAYGPLRRCSSHDDDFTFSASIFSAGFSRLLVRLAADWNLLSFQSPPRTIHRTIVMTLLEKRLNGLWL